MALKTTTTCRPVWQSPAGLPRRAYCTAAAAAAVLLLVALALLSWVAARCTACSASVPRHAYAPEAEIEALTVDNPGWSRRCTRVSVSPSRNPPWPGSSPRSPSALNNTHQQLSCDDVVSGPALPTETAGMSARANWWENGDGRQLAVGHPPYRLRRPRSTGYSVPTPSYLHRHGAPVGRSIQMTGSHPAAHHTCGVVSARLAVSFWLSGSAFLS